MKKVALIHSNQTEAGPRVEQLRAAGFTVETHAKIGPAELRAYRDHPPDAFAIDLNRIPSHGRAIAVALRQYKSTRLIPIVFMEGDPEKVAVTRAMLPDALYSDWQGAAKALAAAIENPPSAPVVPGTMEGYSGTPLVKKLAVKAGSVVALLGAPDGFETTLGALPEGTRLRRQAKGEADIVLLFAKSVADLERRFESAVAMLAEGGGLWIVWPKKTSALARDLSERVVRAFGLDRGLVDYKICAVDQTWSGLLFARRRKR